MRARRTSKRSLFTSLRDTQIVVHTCFLLWLVTVLPQSATASENRHTFSRSSAPDKSVAFLGYLMPGNAKLHPAAGRVETAPIAVLTREPITNDVSVEFGPRWNNRLSNSMLPAGARLSCRVTTSDELPEEIPLVFVPIAGDRHVKLMPASMDAARRSIGIAFEVDKLGADLLTTSMLSPDGLHGVAMFPASNRIVEFRACVREPNFILASVARHDRAGCGCTLSIRSEVEHELFLERLTYSTRNSIVNVCLNTTLLPWQTVSVSLSPSFATVPASAIDIIAEPYMHAPGNFVDSNGHSVHMKSRWADEWERVFGRSAGKITTATLPEITPYAQLWGFRGYRFEAAIGVVGVLLPDDSFLVPFGDVPRRVVWIADSGACFGYGYRLKSGQVKFLLRMSRLALRYSTQEQLLLASEDGEPIARLPRTSVAYDLDYGSHSAIPYEAATIRLASVQAARLAKSEIGRLTKDQSIQRFSRTEFEAEQRRLAPYLGSTRKPR